MEIASETEALIERLSRVLGTEDWSRGFTPTQAAALTYHSRANRFSRAPSHLADYLCTTRGTVSQTLKGLAAKGFLTAKPDPQDKRSLSYALTDKGHLALSRDGSGLNVLGNEGLTALNSALKDALEALLIDRGGRSFGLCRTCHHHRSQPRGHAHCALLDVPLTPPEADQICHEHASAGPSTGETAISEA